MVGSVHQPDPPRDDDDVDDILVPLSVVTAALDDGLDAVHARAQDGADDYYATGLLDGAEQVHRHAREEIIANTTE